MIKYVIMDILIDILKSKINDADLEILNIHPQTLLDLMIKYEINLPIIFNDLHMNPNHLYQTFILYLNKTIQKSNDITKTDLNEIIMDFLQTNTVNVQPYKTLLLFYMSNKKILPFMLDYQKLF